MQAPGEGWLELRGQCSEFRRARACMRETLFRINGLCHTWLMRQVGQRVGQRVVGTIALFPSGEALRAAAVHQATGQALAAVATSGIPKGVYRFFSVAELNRHTEEAVVRAVALNVLRRLGRP